MKVSQLLSGLLLVPFLALLAFGLYASITTQHKSWSDWFFIVSSSLYLLYLAVVYLEKYLKGKKKGNVLDFLRRLKGGNPQLKNNILYVNMWAKESFRTKIALGIVGFSLVILIEFPNYLTMFGFFLGFLGATIYTGLDHSPGIYKNGKYLGTVHAAFIKVGDGLTIGKKQDTATIGSLEILRNGRLVAVLRLTSEGFMELKPDKIHEIFPEIKGNIEKFKDLYKVGDYTLEYKFFQTVSYSYYKRDDDGYRRRHNPVYSFLPSNTFHRH